MKLVFILADALKSLYLTQENMPFLFELSKSSFQVKRVVQSPGFCERSEIFTGLDSFDSGNFTAIGFDRLHSPYRNHNNNLLLASLLSRISDGRARNYLYRVYLKHKLEMRPYSIPYMSLKNYTLTEDGSSPYICYQTLFDSLSGNSKTYTLNMFTTLAELPFKKSIDEADFVKQCVEKEIDFIPVYYGEIDSIGHKYGDDIDSIRPYLQKLDVKLSEIYKIALSHGYAFAVLGDHGMIPVNHTIDITSVLKKSGYKYRRDYEFFLDSTIARFWFFNDKAKHGIIPILEECLSNKGVFVNNDNYKKYRIPLDIMSNNVPVYGDLLWFANPGTLIYPDFFNQREYKGMHGYLDTKHEHSFGQFIAANSYLGANSIEIDQLHNVCKYLCKILNIPSPNNQWKRELNKDR